MDPAEKKIRKIIKKSIVEFLDHRLNEKVSPRDVSKAFDVVAKIGMLMLANIDKYKAAKAKGDQAGVEKYKKIAGDLTKKRKAAEADMENLIQQLDRDAQLAYKTEVKQSLAESKQEVLKMANKSNPGTIITISTGTGKDAYTKMGDNKNWINKKTKIISSNQEFTNILYLAYGRGKKIDIDGSINAQAGMDPLGLNKSPEYPGAKLKPDALGVKEERPGKTRGMDRRVYNAFTDFEVEYFDMLELSKRYLVDDKEYKKYVTNVGRELLKLSKYLKSQKYI